MRLNKTLRPKSFRYFLALTTTSLALHTPETRASRLEAASAVRFALKSLRQPRLLCAATGAAGLSEPVALTVFVQAFEVFGLMCRGGGGGGGGGGVGVEMDV